MGACALAWRGADRLGSVAGAGCGQGPSGETQSYEESGGAGLRLDEGEQAILKAGLSVSHVRAQPCEQANVDRGERDAGAVRTWATERTKATQRAKKLSTAYKVGDDIEGAYDRALVVAERRELMERWGCHVTGRPFPSGD